MHSTKIPVGGTCLQSFGEKFKEQEGEGGYELPSFFPLNMKLSVTSHTSFSPYTHQNSHQRQEVCDVMITPFGCLKKKGRGEGGGKGEREKGRERGGETGMEGGREGS